MEAVHGSYYVKLGRGKYLLRYSLVFRLWDWVMDSVFGIYSVLLYNYDWELIWLHLKSPVPDISPTCHNLVQVLQDLWGGEEFQQRERITWSYRGYTAH